MHGVFRRAVTLAFAGTLALAGCSGSKGDSGANGTNGSNGSNGTNGSNGISTASTGLHVNVVSVSTTSPITVRYTLKDDRGFPVDAAGLYSVNTPIAPKFGLAYTTTDTTGNVLPFTVLTNTSSVTAPTVYQPTIYGPPTAGQGTIVENGSGAGDYTYTFPATATAPTATTGGIQAVAYDSAKLSNTHVLWIQAARQTNLGNTDDPRGFTAVNQDYWFVPAGGTPVKRELVKTDNCSACHRGFKPGENSVAASTFHGGGRVQATFCNICHNPGRTSNPSAEAKVFVHRIHNSEHLQPANVFHGIVVNYPQDIRNCGQCHAGAAQGDQYKTNPTRAACGSCHDYVSFASAAATTCKDPVVVDANGLPVPCNHAGGPQATDAVCATCHGPTGSYPVADYHVPVAPPDTNNIYVGGTNANTNAAWLAAAKAVPAGAKVVTYEVASVDAVPVTGGFNPSIKFRFLVNGTPTPMQTYAAGTTEEILPGFVGSPSVYFAFGVSQDGITAPADFNASGSGYIRGIWNGSVTTATLTGPDTSNYYTIQLNNVLVPTGATILTGGVGYTYSLGSATSTPPFVGNTLPLTEIDLPAYPYTANACTGASAGASCGGTGGLIVPAPDVWKVANGYSGRRPIVDTAKCQTCHVALGAEPTFHAGQRNDAPTCSFCHTPNRTSSGWSATAKNFIHSLHAGRIRTVPFTWHASSATNTFAGVEFPGPLNNCTACHYEPAGYVGHTYAFTGGALTQTSGTSTTGKKGTTTCTVAAPCTCGTGSSACVLTASGTNAYANLLSSTVGQGTYPGTSALYTISPYVDSTGATNYGSGYSYTASTGATVEAAGTTLVNSPIVAACTGCHDSAMAIDHMQANGGKFYEPRSTALAAGAPMEQCLLCHGPNTVADIALMHQ